MFLQQIDRTFRVEMRAKMPQCNFFLCIFRKFLCKYKNSWHFQNIAQNITRFFLWLYNAYPHGFPAQEKKLHTYMNIDTPQYIFLEPKGTLWGNKLGKPSFKTFAEQGGRGSDRQSECPNPLKLQGVPNSNSCPNPAKFS